MRRTASLILAACAAILLLTWHPNDRAAYWIWHSSGGGPGRYDIKQRFDPAWMGPLDFGQKIAGFAFLAGALLAWPRRRA